MDASAFRVEALGVHFEVRLDALPADARRAVAQAWGFAAIRSDEDSPEHVVRPPVDGPEQVADAVAEWINWRCVREREGSLLMLHAAAVADPATGRTVALVGASGAGKSTLCTRLRGMRYVTDETIGIDADGVVAPFAKPIAVFGDDVRKTLHDPARFGLLAPDGPLTIHAVALLERDDGHRGPATVADLGTAEAVTGLAGHGSGLRGLADPLGRLAHLVESQAHAVVLRYREAADAADAVSGLLARPTRLPGDVIGSRAVATARVGARRLLPATPPLWCGEETVVLTDSEVCRLDGAATAVLGALLEGDRTDDELLTAVRRSGGVSGSVTAEWLADAISALQRAGIVAPRSTW